MLALVRHYAVHAVRCQAVLRAAEWVPGAVLGSLHCVHHAAWLGGRQTAHGHMGGNGFSNTCGEVLAHTSSLLRCWLHGVNPELIWASTTPRGESATSCNTYKIGFCSGL